MLVTWCGSWEAASHALTLRGMSTTEIPRGESGPRYVRLQVELVLEVSVRGRPAGCGPRRTSARTGSCRSEEREHAEAAVGKDESEALAYLVDPSDLVSSVPGIELVQASWSCAHTEYDPESDDWNLDEDDDGDDSAAEEVDDNP